MMRHRRRHGPYALASTPTWQAGSFIRKLIAVALLAAILYYVGSWMVGLLGISNPVRNTAAALSVEDRGIVSVSLEGAPLKQANDGR